MGYIGFTMELTADYHTHTKYSDAHCTVLENARRAKEIGLKEIAITDHGFTHVVFGLKRREKEAYFSDVRRAREETGVSVLVGIEGNILGREGGCDLREEDFAHFDVYLAGFHVFSHHESFRDWANGWKGYLSYNMGFSASARLKKDQTLAYIRAVERNPIDILTHVNFQCFADCVEVAKCCRDYGTYIELSGKKTHFTDDELDRIVQTGVRFVLNSDAHSPQRIGDVKIAKEQIARVGVPLERIDNICGRLPDFRLSAYKKRHL